MSLSDSLSICQKNEKELTDKLGAVCGALSAINLASDPSFKVEPRNGDDIKDLAKLSLSHLHREIEGADSTLRYLDELWYIRGYSHEIDSVLSFEREEISESDLDSIARNLIKLKTTIEALDDALIIKQKLFKQLNDFSAQFQPLLKYFFDAVFETSYTFKPFLERSNLHFKDLVKISEKFESNFNVTYGIKQWIHEKQSSWDNLLGFILSNRKYVRLEETGASHKLIESDAGKFDKAYFQSVTDFMNFVNLIENQSVKNFYTSRISKKLVETISNHIEYIKDESNNDIVDELLNLFNTAKRKGWHLSLTLDSKEKITERLNSLYLDWIVEKYVGILKTYFTEQFQADLEDTKSVEVSTDTAMKNAPAEASTDDADDWNNEWDDGDDGWGDEVKLDDADLDLGDESKGAKIVVSKIPGALSAILKSFSEESSTTSNDYLAHAINALAFSSYPTLRESFTVYNDLLYLSDITGIDKFDNFAKEICSQFVQEIEDEFKLIVFSLNVSHDDTYESLDEYDLDDYNLNKLSLLYQAVNKLMDSDLAYTNKSKVKDILVDVIDRINYTFISLVVKLDEITEFQSVKLNNIIGRMNDITVPLLYNIDEPKSNVKSFNKLDNLSFLLNSHLKEIMDRFYEAELYDFKTDELVAVIQSIFIKSDLRDSYISEIIEVRSQS